MSHTEDSITFKLPEEEKKRARKLTGLVEYQTGKEMSLSELCREALSEKLDEIESGETPLTA